MNRTLALAAFTTALAMSSAQASFITDPIGDAVPSGRNITQLDYTLSPTHHQFVLTLQAAPALFNGAGEYSIQINSALGGGGIADSWYIAGGLTGIDQMLVAHFSPPTGLFTNVHLHNYVAPLTPPTTVSLTSIGGTFSAIGNQLTFTVPIASLNLGPFWFYGATYNINEPVTYDITGPLAAAAVPEPGLLTMLASGALAGLFARRRWKK